MPSDFFELENIMQVKLLISRSGPTLSQQAGDIVDVPIKEGNRMIKAGQAVKISQASPRKAARRTRARKATAKAAASK
jgi:hypothetical protein